MLFLLSWGHHEKLRKGATIQRSWDSGQATRHSRLVFPQLRNHAPHITLLLACRSENKQTSEKRGSIKTFKDFGEVVDFIDLRGKSFIPQAHEQHGARRIPD